jgi:hypothetical protein
VLKSGRLAGLGRPAWVASFPPWLGFPLAWSSSLCDFCACVLHKLHRPSSLIHSFACIIGPSTWCLCFESCPCSFASHASMNFLQNKAFCPPMLVICMCPWWKLLEEHPVMHHGACMIYLTRLPPSKHVLRLSTSLISKIKNKFRAIEELKHKFREVFKALKTSVSRNIFWLLLYRSHRYCLPSLVESKLFPAWSWGHRFRFLVWLNERDFEWNKIK